MSTFSIPPKRPLQKAKCISLASQLVTIPHAYLADPYYHSHYRHLPSVNACIRKISRVAVNQMLLHLYVRLPPEAPAKGTFPSLRPYSAGSSRKEAASYTIKRVGM
ncbi:hypothetical protein AAY473_038465 [Plecturocebus cupreus]